MAVASQQPQVQLDSQPQSVSQSEIPTPQELREQSQAVQLPPSERDLEVFEELVVKGLSTRQVAARHRVSQTRIVQIRRKVALWMATMPSEPELTPVQRIRLAIETVATRIDNLYGEAMQAWAASQQPQAECRGTNGSETRTVRTQHGDQRYLTVALRIIERQMHLEVFGQKALAAAKSQERDEQRDAEPRLSQIESGYVHPLDGACSIPLGSKEAQEQPQEDQYDASDWMPGSYDPESDACREFDEDLASFGDTVQLPASDAARQRAAEQAEEPDSQPRRPTGR